MILDLDETICALATAPGIAGIAVIRVSGPAAFDIVDRVTRRRKNLSCSTWHGHTLHRADVIAENGDVIDDVLLAIFHAPRSYTGENVVEVSVHGGPIPVRRTLERLLTNGARAAKPGEFTQRAFLNGKMDLAQAEAVGDIIAARTEEAHKLAQQQQSGRLSKEVLVVRDMILGVMARIEASIDFPEDVGELDTEFCDQELVRADVLLRHLLQTAERGILMREGLKVVLAGRPNVGKSSLLNALLRVSRAIVTPIAGTTRDVLEETMNLRGIPIRAIDTAGIRESEDMVEQIGVERSRESIATADIVLLIRDASVGETPEDRELQELAIGKSQVIVWNKGDLADPESFSDNALIVSAVTGKNLDLLEEAILERVLGDLGPSEASSAVVTHARHRAALETARERIAEARATLAAELPADFVSIDVRGALVALGEITGETATEDIINEIFARFCIGK